MNAGRKPIETIERRVRAARERAIRLAMLSLCWERLWPRLWPLAAILTAALGVFLTDILPSLPGWLHGFVLAGCALAVLWAIRRACVGFLPPSRDEAIARIERDSGFRHRPLRVLEEHIDPAASSPEAQALWAEHRARTLVDLKSLRVRLPRPELARHDPIGFRAAAFLILVIGVTAGAGDFQNRIARALSPGIGAAADAIRIDAWVTPPDYTAMTPFYLTNVSEAAASEADRSAANNRDGIVREIPVGSRIIAQAGVLGGGGEIRLDLDLANQTTAFDTLGAGGYRADLTIDMEQAGVGATRLAIRSGDAEIAGWPVTILPDRPPSIGYSQPPQTSGSGQLRVAFRVEDDFGVGEATLVIRNPSFDEGEAGGDPVRLALPLPRTSALAIETSVIRDTSEHDWAGLPVELQLEATDALGAVGTSEAFPMILPERIFNHPIARTLAEYRKQLVRPSEEIVGGVIVGLESVTRSPQMFSETLSIYLGIRVARARLAFDRDMSEIGAVRKMLWDMAIRLEEGEFALAGRELRDVQERLMQALRDGGYDDSANQLLNELQQALDRYLEALSEQIASEGMEDISDLPGMEYFDREDLQEMIEDARELARTGSTEAAEALLQELARMLESLQAAMNADSEGQEQLNAAREVLERLTGLTRDQQDLLDRTFQEMRRMQGFEGGLGEQQSSEEGGRQSNPTTGSGALGQGPLPESATRQLAPAQDALRQRLVETMMRLAELMGDIPPSVGDAEGAMDLATESLRQGDPGRAVPSQTDALDMLRQTTEGFVEMLTQAIRGMPGGQQGQGAMPRSGSDPFGRLGGGVLGAQMDDGTVKVPDRGDINRSRRIYDELRRRASERHRPRFELNYIERLLTPF